jgi:hypothetical protein
VIYLIADQVLMRSKKRKCLLLHKINYPTGGLEGVRAVFEGKAALLSWGVGIVVRTTAALSGLSRETTPAHLRCR